MENWLIEFTDFKSSRKWDNGNLCKNIYLFYDMFNRYILPI